MRSGSAQFARRHGMLALGTILLLGGASARASAQEPPLNAQTSSGGAHPNALPPGGGDDPGGGGDPGSGTNAPFPVPAEKFATSPGGVDMRTGRYNYSHTDLSIGDTHGLELKRNMISNRFGRLNHEPFGGFGHNWDIFLTESRVQVAEANSPNQYDYVVSITYGALSTTFRSKYHPNQTSFRQLSNDEGGSLGFTGAIVSGYLVPVNYNFTAADGTQVSFRSITIGDGCIDGDLCAYASTITKPDGTRFTLNYDSSNRLRSVVNNWGYALVFEQGALGYAGGQVVTKACAVNLSQYKLPASPDSQICPTGVPTSTYTYTSGFLTGFADQSNVATNIGPAGSAIYLPGAAAPYLTNTLGSNYVVTAQQFSDGRSYSYSWSYDGNTISGNAEVLGGSFTDNASRTATVAYNQYITPGGVDPTLQTTPGPETVTDQLGRATHSDYCTAPLLGVPGCSVRPRQSFTDVEGNKTYFTYGPLRQITQIRKTAKPGSGLADIISSANYGCTAAACVSKPTTVTDARGNTTTYTYDTTHGGVLTETTPADASGVQAVKRYAYVQRSAWISNGSGGFVQDPNPVYLLSEERTCRTTATSGNACAGGTADEVVTTYDYGPNTGAVGNNLLLRGVAVTADGQTRRTCYGYDAQGNRIWETKPRAGLSACY